MNVQHQYKSVLGTAAAIAAAVMGENGHSCDGESHMAGGGRRVDALVPPVGRHGFRPVRPVPVVPHVVSGV